MKSKTTLKIFIISILILIAHPVFAHGMSEDEKHAIVEGGVCSIHSTWCNSYVDRV